MKGRNLMYLLWAVAAILWLNLPSYAQLIAARDSTCTVWTDGNQCGGPSGQGCDSTTFVITNTADVQLSASITCTTPNCHHCEIMGYIVDSGGSVMLCEQENCGTCGAASGRVTLNPDTYTLYCCDIDCDGSDNCANCPTTCVGTATVGLFPK